MSWDELCRDPSLQDLPYKIEINAWGKVEMSPASNRHGRLQIEIGSELKRQLPNGIAIGECLILTRIGIRVPIVAGIMPITNVAQIKRFVSMCGAKIPHPLLLKLEAVENDPEASYATGVEYAIRQCEDLINHGVDGLHFYTLNKSKATVQICKALTVAHAA